MEDGYKNILADKFARETNYVIIKDTDNLDDLEAAWSKFNANMTTRQMRLSDDKSIELYNMTNQQHYDDLKEKLMEKESKKSDIDNGHDEDVISAGDIPDLDADNKDNLEDASKYSLPNDDHIEAVTEAMDNKKGEALKYEKESNMFIVGGHTDNLKELESAWSNFNLQSNDLKRKSDDKCRSLYGISNIELYNFWKAELLKQKPELKEKVVKASPEELEGKLEVVKNSVNENVILDNNMSFVESVYCSKLLEDKKDTRNKSKRFNDTPYFTPQQMIDLGVHGNDNYYSPKADNDGLTKTVSVTTWFDSYKDMISDHIYEDYTYEWIQKMNSLFSDFRYIKESGDITKINARKQSILDLGWNPEVPFTMENRMKATERVNECVEQTIPKDIFISMDNIPECDDEVLSEEVDSSYKPVLLILTKGKTPIVSQGIKFVTKSDYSHASISFDPELNEVYSFNMRNNNWGFIKENLSSFKDNVISVYTFFIDKMNFAKMQKTVYDFANNVTNFDLKIFASKLFHIDKKIGNDKYSQVCSTFVDTVLKAGQVKLTDLNLPAPADIYRGIKTQTNKIFEVFYGIAPKYNGKQVKKKIMYLQKEPDVIGINEACKDLNTISDIYYNSNILYERDDEMFFTEGLNDIVNGVNPHSTKKFYHISFDKDLDEKVLRPRVPSWIAAEIKKDKEFVKELEKLKSDKTHNMGGGYGFEEYKTPRVCFSPSIEGCLNAIINDIGRLSLAGKQIHVYCPRKPIDQYKTKTNKQITKDGDIFDSNITKEMWILEPVEVDYVGSIVVDKVSSEKLKKFANNKTKTIIKYSYKWHWFWKVKKHRKLTNKQNASNKKPVKESFSIVNEVKKFPIEFDKDGNLTIYKCNTNNINYGDEIQESVELLENYRNTNNEEGLKYELSRIWFIILHIEKKMKKKNIDREVYNELVVHRGNALNIFKTNFRFLSKLDKDFNFANYYNNSPFSDNGVKITANTLKYSLSALKRLIF